MSKRGRGKRGCASFSTKLDASDYNINFGKEHLPVGRMKGKFISWFGLWVKKRLPLDLETKELHVNWFDDVTP